MVWTATSGTKPIIVSTGHVVSLAPKRETRNYHLVHMALGNGELMRECFPKHSIMGKARIKKTMRQTKKVRREAWVWKVVTKGRKRNPVDPNQNKTINKQNMVLFNTIWRTYNEIQLTAKWTYIINKWRIITIPHSTLYIN